MSLDADLDADLHAALVEAGVIQTNGAGQPPSISGSAVDAAGRFAGPPPPRLSPADEAEARRIAAELARLHRDGAIASKSAHDPDAVFYARLLRDFGATYTGREPGQGSSQRQSISPWEVPPRSGAANCPPPRLPGLPGPFFENHNSIRNRPA